MVIDDLISQYAPTQTEYTVNLRGTEFRFKVIVSYDELEAIGNESGKFVRLCRSDSCPADWGEFLPDSDMTLIAIYGMSRTCLNTGESELTQLSLMKLAKKAAFLFNELKGGWEYNQGLAQVRAEADAIDDLKNA